MTSKPTVLDGVVELIPELHHDDRGVFFEQYNEQGLARFGITDHFIQDSVSISRQHVLRGLHYQKDPFSQAKLVSVMYGKVFDVAVDIRPMSRTYGRWVGVILDDERHNALYVPKGFAHGFYVLSTEARFFYKISGTYYNKESASGIIWNDPKLAITWPLIGTPILSSQDRLLPSFK